MTPNAFEEIVDGLSDLFTINAFTINKDGTIRWANNHLLETTKKTLQEVKGKHVQIFGEESWLTTEIVIKSQKTSISYEEVNKQKFLTIKVASNDCVMGMSVNVTSLEKDNNAKKSFLSNMSHDLRTPLTGMQGFAALLADTGTTERDREYGQYIHQSSSKLLELLNSILEICKLENPVDSTKKEKIDLVLLTNEIRDLMQPAILKKDLNFQVKLDKLPFVLSDSIKLNSILINLLSNAVKFTHEGEITLVIKLIDVHNEKATLEIQVTDTGIGIPKDHLDSIFKRFYRIEPSYQSAYPGNGLGLSLVKEDLKALGGMIDVKSEEGKGSCFTITLTVPLAFDSYDSYKGLVLLVGNEKFNIRNTEKILLSSRYFVVTKTTGEDALQILKETQEFDWVLMDLNLPDIKGTEVVIRHRQWEKKNKKPRLPIFAFVSKPDLTKEIREECLEIGFDNVLLKPFKENSISMINLLLGKKV